MRYEKIYVRLDKLYGADFSILNSHVSILCSVKDPFYNPAIQLQFWHSAFYKNQ